MSDALREPFVFDPLPRRGAMRVVDQRVVHAPMHAIFRVAREVEQWPRLLRHYRWVRFRERATDGGGVVEMAAWRPAPLGPETIGWPVWWVSEMAVQWHENGGGEKPAVRFRHIEGITAGMQVEWSFSPVTGGIRVKVTHIWDGPDWPVVGPVAASAVIGPLFVHAIASRTLAGLAAAAEAGRPSPT